jgi:hypothetical protein
MLAIGFVIVSVMTDAESWNLIRADVRRAQPHITVDIMRGDPGEVRARVRGTRGRAAR